ncbi:MAG: DUF565 domain-containing protein [Microcystaceae cyanobacterium]
MQRTRLNTLIETNSLRLTQFFRNPWRRVSLSIMSFLLGFFIGMAISTTAGQDAQWDVVGAGLIVLIVELVNRLVYRRSPKSEPRSLWWDIINFFKVGVTYSLFLEAFKLGS